MKALVKKWGNSASVRIPAAVLAEAGLKLDQAVDVRSEGGRIIIERLHETEFDLDDLLSGITADNIHDAADFGEPKGSEAL
jgi:antitoxin MazE